MARKRQRRGPEDYLAEWKMYDDFSRLPEHQPHTFTTIVPLNGNKALLISFVRGVKFPQWPYPFEIQIAIAKRGGPYEGITEWLEVQYPGGASFEEAARKARRVFFEVPKNIRATSAIARSVIGALLDRFDGFDAHQSELFFQMAQAGNPLDRVLAAARNLARAGE